MERAGVALSLVKAGMIRTAAVQMGVDSEAFLTGTTFVPRGIRRQA